MIKSKKGVLSLPIKLTVSFLIISLMVPPMMTLVDNIQDEIDTEEISFVAEDLKDAVSRTYGKSPSYRTHVELEIPSGCHLEVGGSEGMVIRMFVDDEHVGNVAMNVRILSESVLYGAVLLELSNGDGGVVVREL